MPKLKSTPPLAEIYRKAWESCAALWPLFIFRFVFLVLNFGALILVLFLVCWPFVMALWKGFRDSGTTNFPKFVQNIDLTNYIPDPSWILSAIGMGLLYFIWWILLTAMFDGAIYARLRDHQENETPFSLVEFFKDGLRYTFPMIGLQILWFLIFITVLTTGTLIAVMAGLLMKAVGIPWWVGLFMAIPGGFVGLVIIISLVGFGVMGGAYLMEGQGVIHALRRAFQKCRENYGRVVWGILLAWVIYFMFSVTFQGVMSVFGAIPFLNLVFLPVGFFISIFLSIVIWVYMPSLAVSFSLEKEA